MTQRAAPDAGEVEEIAHLSLLVGRLLLLNGADTAQVEAAVVRFAAAFGCEAHLMVSYETLLLTIVAGDHFRTKIGSRVPAMNVGMTVVGAVNRVVEAVERGRQGLVEARAALEAVEHRPPEYARWLVVAALGLTAASLSRLFGGDWPTFAAALLAGAAVTWLRLELARRRLNPIAIPFAAACLGGIIGGAAVLLGASATPSLCLVAPAMTLVPGVPLINGVEDMIRNHMVLGIGRLGFAFLVTTAIALGLFVATLATGVAIPVAEPALTIAVPQDALFSALAALGYAFLFNVPARMAWACVLCGVASHTTRTLCVHLGIDIIAGTLIGALIASFLAQGFARYFDAPAAAFAFPGVVAMVPGAYAFRAVIGGLQIAHGATTAALPAQTLALSITVALMVAAIAVGIAASALLVIPSRARQPAIFPHDRG
ncbi:MAG: threonine/serine ThrE exporter family protein [Stellaceae bacterium]